MGGEKGDLEVALCLLFHCKGSLVIVALSLCDRPYITHRRPPLCLSNGARPALTQTTYAKRPLRSNTNQNGTSRWMTCPLGLEVTNYAIIHRKTLGPCPEWVSRFNETSFLMNISALHRSNECCSLRNIHDSTQACMESTTAQITVGNTVHRISTLTLL